MAAETHASKDATPATCAHNRSVLDALPFGDRAGLRGRRARLHRHAAQGRVPQRRGPRHLQPARTTPSSAHEQAPDTVNPSLWRQARLNMANGLFQVTDRIYQVRGFDISNMTIIEGDRGLIVIDPLISAEVARAGLELYCAAPRPASR